MAKFTPNSCRHNDTTRGIVKHNGRIHLTVVQFDFKTTRYWKNGLMTCPMSMSAASHSLWYIRNPKNTLHREGNVHIALQERQLAPIIHILRELNPFYPTRESLLFH